MIEEQREFGGLGRLIVFRVTTSSWSAGEPKKERPLPGRSGRRGGDAGTCQPK